MKFQIIGPDKKAKMITWDECCVPDDGQLLEMKQAGYTFLKDGKSYIPHKSNVVKLTATPQSKCVRCIENNQIYNTQSEAAKSLGIDPAAVSDSLKTGRPRAGYTFERV